MPVLKYYFQILLVDLKQLISLFTFFYSSMWTNFLHLIYFSLFISDTFTFMKWWVLILKLLSHTWWISISKTLNSSISQMININRTLLWTSLKSLVVLKKNETNMRILWSWKDFPFYKNNRIPFARHFARVKIMLHVFG